MHFSPENNIGLLHDIFRLSAVAKERQYTGEKPTLMTGQTLKGF